MVEERFISESVGLTSEGAADQSSVLRILVSIMSGSNGWGSCSSGDITLRPLEGGITNLLFRCSCRCDSSTSNGVSVLFRIYGENTEQLVSRSMEQQCLRHFSRVYGRFENGCVYEFLKGRPLDEDDLPQEAIMQKVSRALAKFHATPLENFEVPENAPLKLDQTLKEWAVIATSEEARTKIGTKLDIDEIVSREIPWFKENVLRKCEFGTCFSHNDLLAGNIILTDEGEAKFIDFEYGGENYRGFDLGDHFAEFMGLPVDQTRFPTEEQQTYFVKEYVKETNGKIKEEDAGKFKLEVSKLSLGSHLMWGMWSIAQALWSNLEFDYVEYAKLRFDAYFAQKKNLNL